MGNNCLKKQQTIEMSQIFASIPACTRLPLDRHEKVVRQWVIRLDRKRLWQAWHKLTFCSDHSHSLHKGMMLSENLEQYRLRVTLKSTCQNYFHTREMKNQVGLSRWKDADCRCTPLWALCSRAELCPKPSWLLGIWTAQGCKRDTREGGISWRTLLLLRINHRKLFLLEKQTGGATLDFSLC